MTYVCPKGHQSTDSDYCSECGALIGESKITKEELIQASSSSQEICPDCGTPRAFDARFCEVCRHDFQENKTGVAEAIVASQPSKSSFSKTPKVLEKEDIVLLEKLNVVISVDRAKASSWEGETTIKPDSKDRVFPLDLDENLVGRRSVNKGIYPEIEISDPGVSHRHLKFIKVADGSFAVLELGSSNGTELNGVTLEPGLPTPVKAGDVLNIGIWTQLKLVAR